VSTAAHAQLMEARMHAIAYLAIADSSVKVNIHHIILKKCSIQPNLHRKDNKGNLKNCLL